MFSRIRSCIPGKQTAANISFNISKYLDCTGSQSMPSISILSLCLWWRKLSFDLEAVNKKEIFQGQQQNQEVCHNFHILYEYPRNREVQKSIFYFKNYK